MLNTFVSAHSVFAVLFTYLALHDQQRSVLYILTHPFDVLYLMFCFLFHCVVQLTSHIAGSEVAGCADESLVRSLKAVRQNML